MSVPDPLLKTRYISLESYKRDGGGVRTPVWCAKVGDMLGVFTNGGSYKVKRIARDPRVKVASCDVRGGRLGAWYDATCEVIDDPELEKAVHSALRKRYTWQMRSADIGGALSGRNKVRKYLAIRF